MVSTQTSRLAEILRNHMLHSAEEIVGELGAVLDLDGHIIEAQLRTRGDEVETLLLPTAIKPKLEPLMGRLVGICRIDGEYYVRRGEDGGL